MSLNYLKGIYKMFMSAIVEKLGGSDISTENHPMEFWLTVPAIWSDEAKAVTRAAVNFCKNSDDQKALIGSQDITSYDRAHRTKVVE
jgi:hypothetical protein